MTKPVFSAQRITLAEDDVVIINGLPLSGKLIQSLKVYLERGEPPEKDLANIIEAMMFMKTTDEDENFDNEIYLLLWYFSWIIRDYAMIHPDHKKEVRPRSNMK